MKRFGLIGYPIVHSLSPLLFRAGYHLDSRDTDASGSGYGKVTASGHDWQYDLIEGGDFSESYGRFLEEYDGINVTAPFKEAAFRQADIIDPVCGKIGATNLLVKTADGIKAYNTDYYGIILSILEALDGNDMNIPASGPERDGHPCTRDRMSARPSAGECRQAVKGRLRTALVAGCGGAGKAAAVAAGSMGLDTILMNRTVSKADAIAAALPEYGFKVRPMEEFRECFAAADLILYTLPAPVADIASLTDSDFSPVRHSGADLPASNGSGRETAARKILLEANYRNPSFSDALMSRQMRLHKGFTYIPGKHWLLYQAYAGYDLFTGKSPDLAAMRQAVGIEYAGQD